MRQMRRIFVTSMILLFALMLVNLSAFAQDPSGTKQWNFELAPFYMWAVNIEGDVTVRGATAPLKLDFGDIFDALEGVFTAHFEGWWRQKWGFLVDLSYISISDKQTTPAVTVDVDYDTVMTEFVGLYRFGEGPHTVDALGGIRYTALDVDVDIVGLPPKITEDQSWVDPIVGARYRYGINEKWALIFRGDIGGFGVGADFTWNLAGLIHFQPWKHVAFVGGYRVFDVDYEDGHGMRKFKYDIRMNGPILGVNIIW